MLGANSTTRARRFGRDKSAVAAVEFSIILPMLMALGLGGAELMRYLLIQKQVGKAAEGISIMMGAFDKPMTRADYEFMYDSTMVTVPFATSDSNRFGNSWREVMEVGMSSLTFDKVDPACASDCATKPQVKWRSGSRQCGEQAFGSASALNAVPSELQGSLGSLVVADIRYTYQPWFGSNFLPPVVVMRSSFQQPRFIDFVDIQGEGNWVCR
ncbi:MAG: pilus assembly protein [Beijerinckiaceae bacterium]|nr:pilus assembly protein [Beijerinckiaceae bacterium]